MATVFQTFDPGGATFLATGFPQLQKIDGTNFPVFSLFYDAAAKEEAFWYFRAINYGSGNLTLDIEWYADTATSGDVVWEGSLAVITPNTDTQDIETKAFATANSFTDSHLGTTGKRLHRATVTISNLDSLAADDYVVLRIGRDAAAGADTMTGDAGIVLATLSYSDT